MTRRLFAVLIPALASAAFATPALAATPGVTSEAVSANWAGYAATTSHSSGFSAASGSWVQPRVGCSGGQTYSAYWVGLGGGAPSSRALEQEGTQADCSASGQATYYAWYELVPSAQVRIGLAVHPGDRIWARTAVHGDQVTVTVDNKTTGQSFTRTLTMSRVTPDTSTAEWVAEAPSACVGGASGNCQPLPLANFGKVTFTNAYARANGQVRPVSGWTTQAIALSPASGSQFISGDGYGYGYGYGEAGGSGLGNPSGSAAAAANSTGAAPGALSGDGSSFNVAYGASAAATTSTGYGAAPSPGSGNAYDLAGGSGASGYGGSGAYGDVAGSGYGYGAGSGYGASDAYGYGYGSYSGAAGYGSGGYTIVVPTLF
ncbi:MAG TPA: G1 family glutamic endopeptidase [Solirubrobacteraceae bacterium]|nr:G1 family glutamic endopeptidase [Solirubrobacteraceae bacterium]